MIGESTPEPAPDAPQAPEAPASGVTADVAKPDVARPDVAMPTEIGGRDGPEPTRYGDWEKNGRCIDF
jgi:hypothetical protein